MGGSKDILLRIHYLDNENCFSEEQENPSMCTHVGETLQLGAERHSVSRKAWPSLASFACVLLVWITLVFTNLHIFSSGMVHRIPPTLDLGYRPKGEMDIVISMYKEEISSVAGMVSELRKIFDEKGRSVTIIIYSKDEDTDTAELENQLGAVSLVVKRPNIGREGETYLYYILSRFDTLAMHTLFIQAHAHNF